MQARTQSQNRIISTDESTCKQMPIKNAKWTRHTNNANQSCKKKQKQTFPNAYQGRTLINLMLLTSSFLMWLLMVDLQDILVDMLGTNHSTKAWQEAATCKVGTHHRCSDLTAHICKHLEVSKNGGGTPNKSSNHPKIHNYSHFSIETQCLGAWVSTIWRSAHLIVDSMVLYVF